MTALATLPAAPAPGTPVLRLDDRFYRVAGLVIVAVIFGGFGLWAALAPLGAAAVAPGVVTVENYRKTVQHLEGGIVKAIHVRDGDVVEKGQTLITLESAQSGAQLAEARGLLLIATAREARLVAERDGLPRIVFPETLLSTADDPRAKEAVRLQSQTFETRRRAADVETALYERQIEELTGKLAGLRAQERMSSQLVTSYRGELSDYRDLAREGYVQKQKVREVERSATESESRHEAVRSEIASTEVEISKARLTLLQLRKTFQKEVAEELAQVQSELFRLRERFGSLQDMVGRTEVKAPSAGVVLGLAVHTLGAVVPERGRLLDIVPQNESLIVEAKLSPADINRVSIGQAARIRFNGFSARTTPDIEGRLIAVSGDRFVEDQGRSAYYLARVQITPEGLEKLRGRKLELLPGMPAEVIVNTGSRTFLEYLTGPLSDVVARSFIEK